MPKVFARFSQGFREVFGRFSEGFREVFARFFARFSLPIYFRERLRRAEKTNSNQFLRAAGAPAEPGPPRHAKICKNHRDQRSTAKNDCTKLLDITLIVFFYTCPSRYLSGFSLQTLKCSKIARIAPILMILC